MDELRLLGYCVSMKISLIILWPKYPCNLSIGNILRVSGITRGAPNNNWTVHAHGPQRNVKISYVQSFKYANS